VTAISPQTPAPLRETAWAPPAAWPRTSTPLRIAILGWARLSLQQKDGSGYNLSASELAAGLALSGHQVSYLRSGMDYSLRPGTFIRHVETWRGVRCDHIFNSPNLAIARFNFNNLETERSCPAQTKLVLRWLDDRGAQLVHIHSLEGFTIELLGAIADTGRPILITPHNHWYVCPQVDLLARETEVCLDYDGGRRCVNCLPPTIPAQEIRKRKIGQALHRNFGFHSVHALRQTLAILRARIKSIFEPHPEPEIHAPPLHPLLAEPPGRPRPFAGDLHAPHARDPLAGGPAIAASPWDANEQFSRATHHLTVLNDYGKRRARGIDAINRATFVLGPSRALLNILTTVGLERSKARFLPYGQPHFDELNRSARASPFYRARPWSAQPATRPLRFAFHGTVHNNKGLEILVRAIGLMSPALRRRAHFTIRAWGDDAPFRQRLASFPEVVFEGGFDVTQLPYLMGTFDVGILPHVWFENAPLVMFEFLNAGKFVIASRLGGPAEFIRPPPRWRHAFGADTLITPTTPPAGDPARDTAEPAQVTPVRALLGNGLLFPGGDAPALCRCLEALVSGEVTVPSPAEVHEASDLTPYVEHVRMVEAAYAEAIAGARATAK
jgi:glycosyltransferase involved in cell wall biosynthesis